MSDGTLDLLTAASALDTNEYKLLVLELLRPKRKRFPDRIRDAARDLRRELQIDSGSSLKLLRLRKRIERRLHKLKTLTGRTPNLRTKKAIDSILMKCARGYGLKRISGELGQSPSWARNRLNYFSGQGLMEFAQRLQEDAPLAENRTQ